MTWILLGAVVVLAIGAPILAEYAAAAVRRRERRAEWAIERAERNERMARWEVERPAREALEHARIEARIEAIINDCRQ
jgi:hypothetical protein